MIPQSHILVVEDDHMVATLISYALRELGGFAVKVANGGDAALESLGILRPDLILLDRWMPGTGGDEVFHFARQNAQTSTIPIVFVTGDLSDLPDDGVYRVLKKPFEVRDLLSVVRQSLVDSDGLS